MGFPLLSHSNMKQRWNPSLFQDFHHAEHDACGIVSAIEKRRVPTRENIMTCINALVKMNHRAGFINGEGDGVGIHIDIPRALWMEKLANAGQNPEIANDNHFTVGHIFINRTTDVEQVKEKIRQLFKQSGLTLLFESDRVTSSHALGPIALRQEPVFWQVALLPIDKEQLMKRLFDLLIDIEQDEDVHVASLSHFHVVYKVMGAGDILPKYYHDLASPLVASTMTLGHNRYSTNTLSNFFRVQPFSVLGHNGEINTIAKLRDEAMMLGVPLTVGGSDSQDLSRTMETLICRHGYSLFEAMDILFPPIVNEMKAYPEHLQDLYTYIREAWGHFAQGPAGIISRYGEEAVFSVDALGLRPLWKLDTEERFIFASEPGIIPASEYTGEPKPIAPGEKIGLKWGVDGHIEVLEYAAFQEEVYARFSKRFDVANFRARLTPPTLEKHLFVASPSKVHNGQYAAFGWDREHIQLLEQMAEKGAEPIRSLGHDAPLAAIDPNRKNLADFIKESVAVVTNPAIDRDRETEHFSTRTIIGKRPSLTDVQPPSYVVELISPILIEGKIGLDSAETLGHPSYDQVVHAFQTKQLAYVLSATFTADETIKEALQRLANEACEAVRAGKTLLVIDDTEAHQNGNLWMDPLLVTSAIDQSLTENGLRRDCSLLLRSGAIRSLHDFIVAYGLGANAINPYLMFATVAAEDTVKPVINLFNALNKGLEKVISTIGIHELRGYSRLFSSIGLHDEIADVLKIVNFFGSDSLQYDFAALKEDAIARANDYVDENAKPGKTFHVFPRIWKAIGEVAQTGSYDSYREKLTEIETETPTTIRHLLDLKKAKKEVPSETVDISVGEHSLPFVIASMSFGSQNEVAFRAYAEAADRLNMVSLNGEGGEIKDMLGKYPRTRGQQVASGRFGVNAELLNSSNLLEIKIGQGAKPGEGGHLPGSKVTAKIAEARNATIGSDLISPSNNHDIYSIEDLAQMIAELKTANDQAKVAVKVPVVPNIGTIAVGIAKAGADIITLSGFDGGTGAARIHALQHVGLPVEIGVKAAHNALLEAGLRNQVEIWADGGIKSALDVIKVMLLGANRVGFGTLSMIAIGCTTCRGCHLDTCHVGIATQIESEAQAKEHGLRRFVPRQFEAAVQGLVNLFTAFGNELKALTASLGVERLQDIVGRSDLLEQVRGLEKMDLTHLLKVLEVGQFMPKEMRSNVEEAKLLVAAGAEYLDYHVEDLHRSREFSAVTSEQRVLGSRVSCHRVRGRLDGSYKKLPNVTLRFKDGSIPGNGLGAYNSYGIHIHVDGGAQDGIGKTALGGSILIFKAKGKDGNYYNGSVGKGFGYGAQKGLLVAQGNADARAGIRLSGADMIIGGQVTVPIPEEEHGNIGARANIKGFAFEYMTNGRGLVLGDPGPWICAGMTGGVVYLRHQPEMGLTKAALERRIAKGAQVRIERLSERGKADVHELLSTYISLLIEHEQIEEAESLKPLLEKPEEHFFQVIPSKEQADPSVSTE
ncbi:glutamate synthase (NADPH/NADH) large chain [Anoxybacillus voinovskiensis]|uniref:Glutamate synthase (NADPH/NADH) large chain n=2 Tax=Anoxybacteroides voinovskiense TaxID=230470 RepID=A0A840DTW3_9BACL|nr:glutamate synthase (NADPH/NADH) large chain [Anoxybacillus voinovskiensis]GGJ60983.1 glutamate synthase [Anoxybacillus voinovskiensis]